VFTVTLSSASSQTVTVDYTTADGTANAPTDYLATPGTLTFDPGVTSQTIMVAVKGDVVIEPDETFSVDLTNPINATVADGQGVGTIRNDDVTISITDVSVTEGNSGTVNATFTVTLSPPQPWGSVTVNYATADGTA